VLLLRFNSIKRNRKVMQPPMALSSSRSEDRVTRPRRLHDQFFGGTFTPYQKVLYRLAHTVPDMHGNHELWRARLNTLTPSRYT
jgi:hypothetical protein